MISSASPIDSARSESPIGDLTAEQQQRLTQLLDQYLLGLEQGEPVDVAAMLSSNADLAGVLSVYLQKLDGLHGIAAGFQSHGELEPLVSGESGSRVQSLELGDYTIVRELGRGGMGIVYEARQRSLDRRVALKLLPLASMLDSRQIARFKNESHAAAQLQHPNIVSVYNVGIERGIHFYAMQFIEGQTVDTWIESRVSSSSESQWRETVGVAIDVAEALHCAHQCGIVHRDVKPSNLMLDHSGEVWVTDFGLARCQNDLSLTLSGHLVGTIRYMSPEQASGRAELVDHRTDIYSLGATLYEMLTGRVAVPGEDSPSVLREIVSGSPVRLHRILQHVPPDLDVVLRKAMAKDKDDRYATAEEFANDLRAVLSGRPTLAKPPSTAVVVGRWASRHRRLVTAASLVCLVGMIGLMASVLIISQKNRDVKASYARADQYFRQAQDTVGQLGSRVAAQLASVPGTEHIRQSLLKETLAYYQDFVAQAKGDRELRADLAQTHSRIGDLVRELESVQMAIPHYEQSDEIYRELADETPDSASLVQARTRNMNQLGLALAAAGQSERAQQIYEEAISLQHWLIGRVERPHIERPHTERPHTGQEPPDTGKDAEYRIDLALTKNNLGLLLREVGQVDDARVELDDAVERFTAITNSAETNILAVRGLAAALANRSSLTVDSDPSGSILMLEEAIDHQLRISKDSPNRLTASREIATNYNNLGAAYMASEMPREASNAFSSAAHILRRLHGIAPLVDAYRCDLAMSLNNLATLLHTAGRLRESNQAAVEAVDVQKSCLDVESPDAVAVSRLGVMYNNLGTSLEALNEKQEAITAFQSAVQHQRSALSRGPDRREFKLHLLQHYSHLLRLQLDQRRWQAAGATSQAYRSAAGTMPDQVLVVAADLAKSAKLAPAGATRDHLVGDIAELLVCAREKGAGDFDSSLLLREPFRAFAHVPRLRKAVHP